MMKHTYKMRAECIADLTSFLEKVPVESFSAKHMKIQDVILPDLVIEFSSPLKLTEIRNAMAEIIDGHVMLETVALASEYTGERK